MRIGVIGGGVLGALVATGLAGSGHEVDLYERRSAVFSGATAAGEGKIHLGHVYGLGGDATADVMLRAALSFDRNFECLVGRGLDWDVLRGGAFRYVVAPDSLLSPDELVAHGERLDAMRARLVADDPSLTYLGLPLDSCRFRSVAGDPRRFDVDERTVDVDALLDVLRRSLVDRRVRVHLGATVDEVERARDGWRLGIVDRAGAQRDVVHPVVVNCAWDDAARLDRFAGRSKREVPNLRLRTFVHGRVDAPPTAITIVQGPYGDVVIRPDGRLYAAWYPTGLLDLVNADTAPTRWATVLDDPSVRSEQIESTIEGLRPFVPELGSVRDASVQARVVVARGTTDIDDRSSGLHGRDGRGTHVIDGWVSVDSTKLTTAPLAALDVVATVREHLV